MAYILAIDDNAVIRDVIKFTLQDRHDITLASSGKEGISLAENSQFDLIITDINMPEMDGVEFVREIRKNKKHDSTPILVLTANVEDHESQIKESGAVGWVIKPFEPKKLLEAIAEILK